VDFGFEDHVSAFSNLQISHKLMVAFAAVVAIIFVSSAIVYDRLRVIEAAKNLRVHTTDVLDTLDMALEAMLDQEIGVRGYLLTGDRKYAEPYEEGRKTALERADDLIQRYEENEAQEDQDQG